MAVGFRKPHLPFRHPSPWDKLYPDPSEIALAKYKTLDENLVLSRDEKREIDVTEFIEVEIQCAFNINARNWKERAISNLQAATDDEYSFLYVNLAARKVSEMFYTNFAGRIELEDEPSD